MKKIRLERTENKAGKFIYKAFDGDQMIYKSSPSGRIYIAMYISKVVLWNNKVEYHAQYRFGRPDLIGKGDSKRFDVCSPNSFFAHIDHE